MMLSDLFIPIRSLFRRRAVEGELDEELRFHLENQVEKYIRSGLTREEAVRRARIEFGGLDQVKEYCREARGVTFVETFAQDVRYGLRMLRKSPGFTLVAVVTLALGICANAVVFSLLNSLVLRPLNVPGGRNIYQIEQGKERYPSQSYPNYLDIRGRTKAFDGVAAYEIERAGLDTNGTPDPIWIYETSGNYFDVLRVQPYLGRFFHLADEHEFNSSPYIVLGYGYWQSHFQGDRSVVGRVVRLNKHAYTIAGVVPPDFRGTELFYSPDVFAPMVDQEQIEGFNSLTGRDNNSSWIVGRLKPGVTVPQAKADLDSIAAALIKAYPKEDGGLELSLGRPGLVGDMLGGPVHAFVAGLMLLAGLILLAACANLGSLFSARAADRWREVALRLALGSSRGRILRQLLTEAALVSLGGAVLGIVASIALLRALSEWQPIPDIPINVPVNPDAMTYVFALLLALVSGLLFGLIPVRQVMKANPYQGIKQGTDALAGMRRLSVRDVLLALQIALCAVLVTSSLVAVRGMVRSLHSNFGFDPRNTMQANADLSMSGYRDDQVPVMQRRLLDAVSGIPGVTVAGFTNRVPLNIGFSDSFVYQDSTTDYRPNNRAADALQYSVSPGYFEAAKTALLAGRTITWNDSKDALRVALVNREFARRVFGSEQNALGHFFKVWGGTRVEVVGIVEDGKYKTLSEDPQCAMFMSILQSPSKDTWLLVRSNRGPEDLGPALERTLNGLNTGLPFLISTWDRELGTALFAARAASLALGVLGGLGAMLAVTGIFGLGSYIVTKRLRELGIRIALGAQRKQVLRAALGRVFWLLALGAAVGLVLGLVATKVLSFIVYQATPRDPLVLAGVVLTMLLLGLLAAWIPAQRALRADPLILLREE
jgi:macrolide transport system ATP-binding/permease protein